MTGPVVGTDGAIGSIQTPNMNLFLASVIGVTGFGVGSSFGLVSDPVLDKVPPESTLLRLRGSVNMPKNVAAAPAGVENENFAVGIGVMEIGAALLGAFPNPASPEGGAWDGWMWYRSQQQGNLDANSGIVDIKSMRKVQSGSSIIFVGGTFAARSDDQASGTTEANIQINLRALILLP